MVNHYVILLYAQFCGFILAEVLTNEVHDMFSFICANCGYQEILHEEDSSLEVYARENLWPDAEYQEDPEKEISAQSEATHKQGYRYSLSSCPYFKYREKDRSKVIDKFSQYEYLVDYLPGPWGDEALEKYARRVAQEDDSVPGYSYLPISIHVFYDPNSGRSYVVQSD